MLLGCGGESGTYALIQVQRGDVLAAVTRIEIHLALEARGEDLEIIPRAGESEIVFPLSAAIRLRAGAGELSTTVTARGAGGARLATASATVTIVRGQTSVVPLTFGVGPTDGGVSGDADAEVGPDASIRDADAPDARGLCGDGLRNGVEPCDGLDLGGATCVSLPGSSYSSGSLACNSTCTDFLRAACVTNPPSTPGGLRKPMNGAMTGLAASARRPTFAWYPPMLQGDGNLTYRLELATDPAFAAATTISYSGLVGPSFTPTTDLPVNGSPPVGRRYFWRVRACSGSACSPATQSRHVDLGRGNGDFNGDGRTDLLVGSDMAAGQGKVMLHLGMAGGVSSQPSATFVSDTPNDGFGRRLAAGDVNGDGFADLVIAAPLYAGRGRVSLFLGNASLDTVADAHFIIPATAMGVDSVGLADVNGDGLADLLVGSQMEGGGGSNAGHAFVVLAAALAPHLSGSVAELHGNAVANAGFGRSVAATDLDGDGTADVIVGAPHEGVGGRIFVYRGARGTSFDDGVDFQSEFGEPWAGFGEHLAAGDLDGDGLGDLVAAAPFAFQNQGAVRIFFSQGSIPGLGYLATEQLIGGAQGDGLGGGALVLGQVGPADGPIDLIVGSTARMLLSQWSGGSRPFDVVADAGTISAGLGFHAVIGDFDGDGLGDVAAVSSATGDLEGYLGGLGRPPDFLLPPSGGFPTTLGP